jgi:hypothetical protein
MIDREPAGAVDAIVRYCERLACLCQGVCRCERRIQWPLVLWPDAPVWRRAVKLRLPLGFALWFAREW